MGKLIFAAILLAVGMAAYRVFAKMALGMTTSPRDATTANWLRYASKGALAAGLGLDLVAAQPGVFAHLPGTKRTSFDEAVTPALHDDDVPLGPALLEAALRVLWPARRSG